MLKNILRSLDILKQLVIIPDPFLIGKPIVIAMGACIKDSEPSIGLILPELIGHNIVIQVILLVYLNILSFHNLVVPVLSLFLLP